MSEESNTIIDVSSSEPILPEEVRWISVDNQVIPARGELLAEILRLESIEAQKTSEEKLATAVENLDKDSFYFHLRANRDMFLLRSDWTQVLDVPLSDAKRAEWATYRQQLRDFPSRTFVGLEYFEIPWPVKPE